MKGFGLVRGAALLSGVLAAHTLWKNMHRTDLHGQIVLITGASRGLGLLVAREFARQGCQVIICARIQDELEEAQTRLRDWGVEAFALICDVSDQTEVSSMVETVRQRYGHVDILVNNAGTIQVTPIQSATIDDFQQAMGTMFWGGLYTTLALLPQMEARRSGHIVNITSLGGKIGVPHLLPYVAAKFAMTGFSEGLSAELAGSGVHVTTITPGLMRTGSYLNAFFKGKQKDEFRWFGISDNLPVISMDAEVAARAIVEAVKRGETEYVLTLPAKVLTRFYGLFPQISIPVIGWVTRILLPAPTDNPSTTSGMNIQAQMGLPLFNWLTRWGRNAARRFNQYSTSFSKVP
jgi:short-subunit dehydrogenase